MPDTPTCSDCGTPYHGAAGPTQTIMVPTCWCEDDKRKEREREEYEQRKGEG